ncbi:sugar transferase [bacterium]|nr:sugar transferase [candidate division CSSED10-310 bacterium]
MTRKYFTQIVIVTQVFLDLATVILSFIIGYYIYHLMYYKWQIGVGVQPFKIYRNLAIGSGVLFLIIFERFGLYSRKLGMLNIEEIKRIFQSLIIGSMILFSLSFLLRPAMIEAQPLTSITEQLDPGDDFNLKERGALLYSRLIMMYSLIVLMVLINLQRSVVNTVLLRRHIEGPGLNRVLIYGAGEVGRQLQRRLFENPRIGMKPIGFIDDDLAKVGTSIEGIPTQKSTSLKVLGSGLDLPELVSAWDAHEVIIALPNASTSRIYEIINTCIQIKVKFSFVPNLFDMLIQQVHLAEIEGIPLLRMKSPRISYIYLTVKRVFDIAFALACLMLSLPAWPFIILAIKIDSEGPVFFSQERIGRDGNHFQIYKFRSMRCDVNSYETSPKDNLDRRVTRVGRWLRKFSIDEIPQFINVLKGDMSIVGPRPEMPFKVENYTPLQKQRLKVRPGITGIWQISSARGSDIHENLDYDFYYTENQSFLLDIVIIMKTIAAAIRGRGL